MGIKALAINILNGHMLNGSTYCVEKM